MNHKVFNINWIVFLQMLSIERTWKFASELEIPVEKNAFPDVMKWARAHLEIHVFSSFLYLKQEEFHNELVEAWQEYREIEGIIEEKKLKELAENYLRFRAYDETVYSAIASLLKPDVRGIISSWFTENYPPLPTLESLWYVAIRNIAEIYEQGSKSKIICPISKTEYELIKASCARYNSSQFFLDMRFYTLEEIAQWNGPTLWERVLQNHPPGEGTYSYFPWLITIKNCLLYHNLRMEWTKLRNEIGIETMAKLTKWVRQNSTLLLQFSRLAMPEEPKPL